jgi:L-ascorbate metabolism protein UlaG (beta-lactamase superfamily)
MRLQFCGHSCFLIQAQGLRILVDPFIRPNAAATAIDADSLNPTHILLTHGHEDHVADAESITKASGAELIAPYETAMWFSAKGVESIRAINPGASFSLEGAEGTVHIRTVGAVHSSTLPDGSPGGVACGYLLSDGAYSVYHAGDTALSVEFDLIGRMWTPDVALLPIGGTFTMGYADLPAAMDMLNCRQVVGMHYDTFPPIEIDREEAIRTAEDAGGQLHLPDVGDTLDIPF